MSGPTSAPAHTQNYVPAATFADSIIDTAPQAIARLCTEHGQQIWTGVVISEAGEILTTSHTLGDAPIVDIELWDSTRGQACVTGRDDDIGLALLKPFLGHRSYDFIEFSGTAPTLGNQLRLLQHSRFSPSLDHRITRVNEYRSVNGGYDYFRIQTVGSTPDGAVIMDHNDQVQGIRMPSLWLLQNEIGDPGDVWAIDAPKVATTALPLLRSGRMHIVPWWWGGISTSPGVLPVTFHGELTVDGVPAPVGSAVYARVSKEGQPDYWTADPTGEAGYYFLHVDAPPNIYAGATIEFWMDCRRASATAVYDQPQGSTVDLDLAF